MLIYLSYNHDFVLQQLNSKKQSQKWMETRFQENKSRKLPTFFRLYFSLISWNVYVSIKTCTSVN